MNAKIKPIGEGSDDSEISRSGAEPLDHENKKLKLDEDDEGSGKEDEMSENDNTDSDVDNRADVILDIEKKGGNGNLVQVENLKEVMDKGELVGEDEMSDTDNESNDSEEDDDQYVEGEDMSWDLEEQGGDGDLVQVDKLKKVVELVEEEGEGRAGVIEGTVDQVDQNHTGLGLVTGKEDCVSPAEGASSGVAGLKKPPDSPSGGENGES